MVIVSGFGLLSDFFEGTDFNHVAQEAALFTLSLITLTWLLFDIRQQTIEIKSLRDGLSAKHQPEQTPGKTVRQQASSIYKKANLNGCYAFSAWFIEDVL